MKLLLVSSSGQRVPHNAADIDRMTERVAAGLAGRGVRAGDIVLVRLPKGLHWLTTIRALWRLGAVSLPCPHQLTEADVADRMHRSGARLALLEPGDVPLSDGRSAAADPGASAPAFLLYTSGTEGPPKGVLHRRSYVAANRLQAERWMGVRPGDRVWCTAAAGWSKSLRNVWLAAELCAAEAVIHEGRFDAGERLALIEALRPDVLCMSPTEYRLCAQHPDFGSADLAGVRELVTAGEALDAPTIQRWAEAHGVRVRDGYGQTETGVVAGVCAGEQAPPGAIGRALPGVQLRVEDGELCVHAGSLATLFAGYWRDDAATGERLRDGWWYTGDLVHADADGLLWYDGRRDDVISSSGHRIGPGEVESALATHPAVAMCAVIGLPDAERGQVVHADVVLASGFEPSPELAEQLRRHVRGVTAPYKHPRSLRFVDRLPMTATGKVRRSAIRDELAGLSPS